MITEDERGRLKKGHTSLYKGKQAQPEPIPEPDVASADFDAAIIAAAHSYGSGTKVKSGLAGYCSNLWQPDPSNTPHF